MIGATRARAGSDAHGATAASPVSVSGCVLPEQLGDETASIQPGGHVDLPEWFLLECATHTDGGEQWRSIAKTFAFLSEGG